MKQVTMAGVKELIAELNNGGVSLREEYVLACLQQLVAVTEQVRLLTEQRDAVVAENAELKSVLTEILQPGEATLSREHRATAVAAIDTPATDAQLAALRAEASADAFSHAEDLVRNEIACLKERSPTLKEMACLANAFHSMAGQLRESKGAQG